MSEEEPARRIARTTELLWGTGQPGKRGPKPRLSLDKIARAAIAIADADGLAAVSMQRVAADLGYTPMSLYTYVPNKELLLEAMLDVVAGSRLPEPREFDDWRTEMHAYVADMWKMFERHPWVLHVQVVGPPTGPGQLGWFERLLSILDKTGLSLPEYPSVGLFLLAAVRGMAKLTLDMRDLHSSPADARAADAASDSMIAKYVDPVNYPLLTSVYSQPPPKTEPGWYRPGVVPEDLRYGTDRLLDGIEAQVARSRDTG